MKLDKKKREKQELGTKYKPNKHNIHVTKPRNQQLYVDVVEKVWASVGSEGTVIRAEVTGCILVRCFLPGNPTLTLSLNTPLSSTPSAPEGRLNGLKRLLIMRLNT